jgi:hypothetical protein
MQVTYVHDSKKEKNWIEEQIKNKKIRRLADYIGILKKC